MPNKPKFGSLLLTWEYKYHVQPRPDDTDLSFHYSFLGLHVDSASASNWNVITWFARQSVLERPKQSNESIKNRLFAVRVGDSAPILLSIRSLVLSTMTPNSALDSAYPVWNYLHADWSVMLDNSSSQSWRFHASILIRFWADNRVGPRIVGHPDQRKLPILVVNYILRWFSAKFKGLLQAGFEFWCLCHYYLRPET